MENEFQEYKGLCYRYMPSYNCWEITNCLHYNIASVWRYCADHYRLDQCLELTQRDLDALADLRKKFEYDLIWGDNLNIVGI